MSSPSAHLKKQCSIWVGFDSRQQLAYDVCLHSMRAPPGIPVRGLYLQELRMVGLYTRPTEQRGGQLWDVISDAPMSTEFAISRFLVPHLARTGWAAFMDCDMLVRGHIGDLFLQGNEDKAVMVVKHDHKPLADTKMDGQMQTLYKRKNWSSMMLFNCDHPSNRKLTVDMINTLPGRDLHRFCWLRDDEIGSLDHCWNYLVGHTPESVDPEIVHFTDGGPWMEGYESVPYAEEWRQEQRQWQNSR
jgi:hypothetical protein